jgi:hypothetical protein
MAGRFVVAHGICAGEYDAVLLSTDLEPDDVVAIQVLAPQLRHVPLLVIVGEGPVDKRQMAADCLAKLSLDARARIVQGRRSSASWPESVATCYSGSSASKAKLVDEGSDELVRQEVHNFLLAYDTPFALLLKPPHELLGQPAEVLSRTVGALYGSFNLKQLCDQMDSALNKDARCRQMEAFLRTFKALLWVERSLSVGRDSVVEPKTCPVVWSLLDEHPHILQHVLQWNADTMRAMSNKLTTLEAETAQALSSANGINVEQYMAAGEVVSKAEKRIKVMNSIAKCCGRQLCHADTLVAACLLDGTPDLAQFIQRSKVDHDQACNPIFIADESSTVGALLADEGGARQQLETLSFAVLVAAYEQVGRAITASSKQHEPGMNDEASA